MDQVFNESDRRKRGRKSEHTQRVFLSLTEAVQSDYPADYTPFRVEILGKTRYTMASSSANAIRMTAYALEAKAIPISIREIMDMVKKREA